MRFRRKSAEPDEAAENGAVDAAAGDASVEAADDTEAPEAPEAERRDDLVGPYDADDLPDDDADRVDLGSLLIQGEPGRELRMQVEESSGAVQAVMLVGADGALELRAFAAPRHGDLWSEVRPQIAEDMVKRGGQATEAEGPFGTELHCRIEVQRPDGTPGVQPSRIIGVNGPRWLLRATLLGRPALEPELGREWEQVLSRVAVQRGAGAMPVGEPLPLALPDNARRVTPPARS